MTGFGWEVDHVMTVGSFLPVNLRMSARRMASEAKVAKTWLAGAVTLLVVYSSKYNL